MTKTRTGPQGSNRLLLGIDLGTSRSVVCASNGARAWLDSYVGYPKDFVARNKLTFRLLSDEDRAFQSRLGLPMFETAGELYLQRLTFILHDGIISSVRYPIPEPERDAAEVLAALS